MKLWVLEHSIAKVTLYINPDGETVESLHDALKFATLESCLEYCNDKTFLLKFSPKDYIFNYEQ